MVSRVRYTLLPYHTVGPRYNGNGYKGYPDKTVKLFSRNSISLLMLPLYKGKAVVTEVM